MPTKKEVKFIQLIVRLGSVPRFEVHADDRVRIQASDAKYHVQGAVAENLDVLQDILHKIQNDYPASGAGIELYVDEGVTPKAIVAPPTL